MTEGALRRVRDPGHHGKPWGGSSTRVNHIIQGTTMIRATRWLAMVALATPVVIQAQESAGRPVVIGRTYTINSAVMGEPRIVDVGLPVGYDANLSQRYPVLYVLDGEVEGEAAITVTRFYAAAGQLPPMIVIGVRNTRRSRDLTTAPIAGFTVPAEAGVTGGAGKFLHFLSGELIPWVDQHYRTAPMRVLVGHSLGGLFALDVLATRPAAFTGYVVMEPSTWWNNGRELAAALSALATPATHQVRVMLVNTGPVAVDTTGVGGDAAMVRLLRVRNETHTSMPLAGMMQALRVLFADFQPARWEPGTRPIAMLDHYDVLSRRLGFQVPIPGPVYEEVFLMSVGARDFDDAERVLDRMARDRPSDDVGALRQQLAAERATPAPAGLIPLVIPSVRPGPLTATAFIGHWVSSGTAGGHEVDIEASGDTIVVRDRVQLPDGEWIEDDAPVIGVTANGELEWGQRVFRGIAALLVLRGQVGPEGLMTVTKEVRGWVPRGPADDMLAPEQLRRAAM